MCPRCAAVLRNEAVFFVNETAFCTPCGQDNWWASMRDSQVLRTCHFVEQVTRVNGLLWYVPKETGPPTVLQLAKLWKIDSMMALFPMGAHGCRMEPPQAVNAMDIQDAKHKFENEPYDHANDTRNN